MAYVQSAGNIQNHSRILTFFNVLIAPNVFVCARVVRIDRVELLRPAKRLTDLFGNGNVLRVPTIQAEETIERPSPAVPDLHNKVPVFSWEFHAESPFESS